MERDREEEFYKACHQISVRLMTGEDMAMDQIADKLLSLAKKLGLELSDTECRKIFLRVFIGIIWQRLESAYCTFSSNAVFEERLLIWLEAFLQIRRPIILHELTSRHIRENPRPPLLCDIYQRLSADDLGIIRPAQAQSEGSTPGYAQRLFEEWKEKRKLEKKNGTA